MTDVQGVALLALFSGVAPSEAYRGKRIAVSLWNRGWIDGFHEVTKAGRDALAVWLTRDVKGPFLLTPKQQAMTAAEARVMLAILAGRDPHCGKAAYVWRDGTLKPTRTEWALFKMRQRGWISDFGGSCSARSYGREALACWLLRGLK